MYKRFFTAALAALVAAVTLASPAYADETVTETSGDVTGTFKFVPDWDAEYIHFYIWDVTADPVMYATKDGWTEKDTWGSNKTKAAKSEDGSFESFEITFPEGHDLSVIFYDMDTGEQTYDCALAPEAIGDTAEMTGEYVTAPADSDPSLRQVKFKNSGLTMRKRVNHDGSIEGETITPYMDPAKEVATYVLKGLGGTDPLTKEPYVTEEKAANVIKEFGTNANDVWTEYLKFEGQEKYSADEAKKVIKPDEETASEPDASSKPDAASSSPSSSDTEASESAASAQSSNASGSTVKSPSTGYSGMFALALLAAAALAAAALVISGHNKKAE